MQVTRPSPEVLAGFGIISPPERLPGGQGQTFAAGDWILKPSPNAAETAWIADALMGLDQTGFRVARHKRAVSGAWVVSGWSVQERLEGEHRRGAWAEVIAAGNAFHRALIDRPRPAFLDAKTDPWAVADRVAWGEQPYETSPAFAPTLGPLFAKLRTILQPSQLIHGDLTGNVLFSEGLPPAIVDISPYWRPADFGAAVVVVDALTWEDADLDLVTSLQGTPELDQLLLRAAIRRVVEFAEHCRESGRHPGAALARHSSAHQILTKAHQRSNSKAT